MALETPSRPPTPFMANAILNFHFDFLTPSLIEVLAHAIYSISRSFASCPHCLERDGSEGVLCRPCSKAGEQTHDGFRSFFLKNDLDFQVRKSLMSGLAWTSYEAAVFSKKNTL